jgi:hypothetical protein
VTKYSKHANDAETETQRITSSRVDLSVQHACVVHHVLASPIKAWNKLFSIKYHQTIVILSAPATSVKMPTTVICFFLLVLSACVMARSTGSKCPSSNTCGWELMELGTNPPDPHRLSPILQMCTGVPIAFLGDMFANQTDSRAQCVIQEGGEEYCTCVFECGNGIWSCAQGSYRFEKGCKKYCHKGECDGDGA